MNEEGDVTRAQFLDEEMGEKIDQLPFIHDETDEQISKEKRAKGGGRCSHTRRAGLHCSAWQWERTHRRLPPPFHNRRRRRHHVDGHRLLPLCGNGGGSVHLNVISRRAYFPCT